MKAQEGWKTLMKRQRGKKFATIVLFYTSVFLIAGAVCLGMYLFFNPSDRIKVTISQLPRDTVYISFVSESNGIMQNMDWYPRSETRVPFTMRPSESVWSSLELKKAPEIDWDAYVQWRCGERYGVVTRTRSGSWRVTWLKSKDVPIKAHRFIIGNGEAYFDLNKGKTIILQEEQLRDLRLLEFPFLEER
jgi:hypothetical protein